jgi:hypothetical protein
MDENPISKAEFADALAAQYGEGDWLSAMAQARKILEDRGTLTAQDIHDTLTAAGVPCPPVETLEARMRDGAQPTPAARREFEQTMHRTTHAARAARRN